MKHAHVVVLLLAAVAVVVIPPTSSVRVHRPAAAAALPLPLPALALELLEDGTKGEIVDRLRHVSRALAQVPLLDEAERSSAVHSIWTDIEAIIKLLWEGIKQLLEPVPLGNLNFAFNNSLITGDLLLDAVTVGHLRDLEVHRYGFNLLTLCAEVDLRHRGLSLRTLFYDVDVTAVLDATTPGDVFRIFGKGPARVDLSDIKIYTEFCVLPKKVKIEMANMQLSVGKADVNIEYLFSGETVSQLISGIATDIIPAVIEEFQANITGFIMDTVNKYIAIELLAAAGN